MTESKDNLPLILGIDPGAKFCGVSVRQGDKVLLSSTYARPEVIPQVMWAKLIPKKIEEEVFAHFPEQNLLVGIEDVTSPSAFMGGKMQLLNPKNTIKLAIVVGTLAQRFPQAVMIRPSKNGSQEQSTYPEELVGRRPNTLLGSNNARTRDHERSAYDIAGLVEAKLSEGYKLDMQVDEISTELLNLPITFGDKKSKPKAKTTTKEPSKNEEKHKPAVKSTVVSNPKTKKENNLNSNNLFGEYL
jgi:hypothetical protein